MSVYNWHPNDRKNLDAWAHQGRESAGRCESCSMPLYNKVYKIFFFPSVKAEWDGCTTVPERKGNRAECKAGSPERGLL